MKDLIKNLLATGITLGLSDRTTFVKEVSSLIEKYQSDPEQAEKWATGLVAYLEQTRNNFQMQDAFKSAVSGSGVADKEKIDELTAAIKELTRTLKDTKA